jgi:hypothetical protein
MVIQRLLIFDIRDQSEDIPCKFVVRSIAVEFMYSQNSRYSLACSVLSDLKCETGPSSSKVRI